LGQAFLLDELPQGRHHLGPKPQIAGLGGRKSEIGEYVAAAFGDGRSLFMTVSRYSLSP
jgi:hypothetical protein